LDALLFRKSAVQCSIGGTKYINVGSNNLITAPSLNSSIAEGEFINFVIYLLERLVAADVHFNGGLPNTHPELPWPRKAPPCFFLVIRAILFFLNNNNSMPCESFHSFDWRNGSATSDPTSFLLGL
jgi:hypothetical protein